MSENEAVDPPGETRSEMDKLAAAKNVLLRRMRNIQHEITAADEELQRLG